MKKIFFAFCLFFSLTNLSAGGFGLSGAAAFGSDFYSGARLDYQFDSLPFICFSDFILDDEQKAASFGVEFLAGNLHLGHGVNFCYAPEFAFGWDFSSQCFLVGNAFYTGLNGFLASPLEFFIQGGWAPVFYFSSSDAGFELLNFPVRAGIRFWRE